MERIRIPDGPDPDKSAIAELSKRCGKLAQERYGLHEKVRHRLLTTFGEEADGTIKGKLNQKANAWWELSIGRLGAALKTSFKLPASPFKNPRTADQWEPYLTEHKTQVESLSRRLTDAEAELNDRVYHLFDLTPDEIKLLQREVEH